MIFGTLNKLKIIQIYILNIITLIQLIIYLKVRKFQKKKILIKTKEDLKMLIKNK